MKSFRLTILMFLFSCTSIHNTNSKNSQGQNNNSIPTNRTIDINLTSIDSTSISLYKIIRFYFHEQKNNGIILVKKSNKEKLYSGQKLSLKLCDIEQYQFIFNELDTTSIGHVPLIYGKQDGLTNNVDTLTYRGHFMINGKIINDDRLTLDFADSAIEPVFEICIE